MAQYELKINELDDGGKDFKWVLSPEWLDRVLDAEGVRTAHETPAVFQFRAELTGKDVVVHGRISAELITPCIRCLNDAHVHVDTEIAALFEKRGNQFRPPPMEEELTPEELDRDFFSGDTIPLDELMRETLLVEIPMQPICKSDCQGIEIPAHVRGDGVFDEAKKSVDNRLAGLADLMKSVPALGDMALGDVEAANSSHADDQNLGDDKTSTKKKLN